MRVPIVIYLFVFLDFVQYDYLFVVLIHITQMTYNAEASFVCLFVIMLFPETIIYKNFPIYSPVLSFICPILVLIRS